MKFTRKNLAYRRLKSPIALLLILGIGRAHSATVPTLSLAGNSTTDQTAAMNAFASSAALGSDMQFIVSHLSSADKDRVLQETKLSSSKTSYELQIRSGRVQKVHLAGNDWRIHSIANTLRRSQELTHLRSIYQTVRDSISSSLGAGVDAGSVSASIPEVSGSDTAATLRAKLSSLAQILKTLQASPLNSRTKVRAGNSPLTEVLCVGGEIGNGSASDSSGQVVTTEFRSGSLSGSGLVRNLDWPLKPFLTCIKDQGNRGTSSAFATVAALETLIEKKLGKKVNLSEQSLYFDGKGMLDVSSPAQDGVLTLQVLDGLSDGPKAGSQPTGVSVGIRVPLEKAWTYNPSPHRLPDFSNSCVGYKEFCSDTPSQGNRVCTPSGTQPSCKLLSPVNREEEGVQIRGYDSIWDFSMPDESARLAIHTLQSGTPLIQDLIVTDGFLRSSGGRVPLPQPTDQKLGGHSMELVGFASASILKEKIPSFVEGSTEGYFIAKNSWGPGVGDGGYFYLPLEYVKKYTLSMIALKDLEINIHDSGSEGSEFEDLGNLGGTF